MRDIAQDFRSYKPGPSSTATVTVQGAGVVTTGNDGPKHGGWREAPQIKDWKPPGLETMDRMMDQADLIDRAARARELAEAAVLLRPLKDKPQK
jgi:hypothetical protein